MTYLFLGYTVVWVALFLYLVHLTRRTRELEKELELLKSVDQRVPVSGSR